MRLAVIMLFVFIGLAQATESYSQSAILTLDVNNKTLQDVLDEIEKQSEFHFFYNNKQVNTTRVVSVKSNKKDVFDVLNQLFNGTDISYKVLDKSIILSPKEMLSEAIVQQTIKTISGTVTDAQGEPIIGANVIEKGSTNGTVTDIDGKFNLSVPEKAILVISYIGYVTKDIPVGNNAVIHVQLAEDSQNIQEVVVTALGIKREEKALGYAVQKVSGESLNAVKTVDVGTALTGKIAGLNVQNSSEFNDAPKLLLRGETPLLVIDGVPYNNMTLSDIASDDIESVDVLKGATASALYGARGGHGAVMITTKRGKEEGLHVNVNSNTMFNAGYLKLPEVQTAYSSGGGGTYGVGDYVWGDKLDIGRTAEQYNPYTYQWEEQPLVSKGKNNLKNFTELSLVTNNNISITQKGKYGSVRASFTHVYNKGQYPNSKMNKITYSVAGDMKWNDFSFEGGITYNKRLVPTDMGAGYGGGGFLYNLLVWSGSEYDIRDYKNYWVKGKENIQQNWMDPNWYDNPYLIANEITQSSYYDIVNGYMSAAYDFTPWLKLSLRSGIDSYSEKKEWQNPISALGGWSKKGYYGLKRLGGFSINNDALLTADHTFGDFAIDGFVGGTIYYYQNDNMLNETQNGLTIPGFYSLKASVDPIKVNSEYKRKQVNSIYGKASASWKSTLFVDVTARNDWSSTLDRDTRSYFYPSVSGSLVLSQIIPLPEEISFWKVRGSWTQTKKDLDVYDTNNTYTIESNVWDGLNTAYYPDMLRGTMVKPSASRSYEIGTAFSLFQNRLRVDATYYNTLYYNLTSEAQISPTSGFGKTLINIEEEQVRKGGEITLSGDVIKTKEFEWNSTFNWSMDRYYYAKVDPVYSTQLPWVKAGERWDWIDNVYDYERDPQGNIIHEAGYPVLSKYKSVVGHSNPDWIWGFSNTVRYKGFTLNVTFDGRVGGKAHSVTDQALWNSGAHIKSDNEWRYDEVVNGNKNYIGPGVMIVSGSADYDSNGNITRDDRVFAPNNKTVSYETYTLNYNPYIGSLRTQNIFDQTFFKLRNLSLSYALPKDICGKAGMKGATIGFVGQNLFLWTKEFKYSDPDKGKENLNSPSMRYLGFNVKLDF